MGSVYVAAASQSLTKTYAQLVDNFHLIKRIWRFNFIRKATEGLLHHVDWVKIMTVELISRPQHWNSFHVCLFVFLRTDKQVKGQNMYSRQFLTNTTARTSSVSLKHFNDVETLCYYHMAKLPETILWKKSTSPACFSSHMIKITILWCFPGC